MAGSSHAAWKAAARTAGAPATYAAAGKHRLVVHRLEPELPDLLDTAVEFVAVERACRGDDRDAVAGRQRARLAHHAKRAISSAIAWCSSRPSAWRRALPSFGRGGNLGGEKPLLGALLPPQRVVDPGNRDPILFDGMDERFEGGGLRIVVAAADQHAVAAGRDRADRRVGHRVAPGNRLHLEIVAQDDALVAQLLPQHADDARRQRRGRVLVERRHEDVRRHDGRDLGLDRRPERRELDFAQPVGRMLDERQLQVGIGAGVAMSGKVLAAGGHALRLAARG